MRSMSLGHSNPNQTPALMQQRARGEPCSRYGERGSQSDGGARVPQGFEAQARTYSAPRLSGTPWHKLTEMLNGSFGLYCREQIDSRYQQSGQERTAIAEEWFNVDGVLMYFKGRTRELVDGLNTG